MLGILLHYLEKAAHDAHLVLHRQKQNAILHSRASASIELSGNIMASLCLLF